MGCRQIDVTNAAEVRRFGEIFERSWHRALPRVPSFTTDELVAMARRQDGAERLSLWLLSEGSDALAVATAEINAVDHLSLGWIRLFVDPLSRRAGHGSTLLRHVEGWLASQGRHEFVAFMSHEDPAEQMAGECFAARNGYRVALRDETRIHPVPLDTQVLDRLEAVTSATDDYQLISWRGRCPEALLEGRARLASVFWLEAPTGELPVSEERWDNDRIRRTEDLIAAMGRELVATGVVHRPSGDLVGFTEITVAKSAPQTGFQWDTIVDRRHRGASLGIRLKVANLGELAASGLGVAEVLTYNAASNLPMIAVNERLGCEVVARGSQWLKELQVC